MIYTDPEATETEGAGFCFAKLAAHGALLGMNQRETLITRLQLTPHSAFALLEWLKPGYNVCFRVLSSSLTLLRCVEPTQDSRASSKSADIMQ